MMTCLRLLLILGSGFWLAGCGAHDEATRSEGAAGKPLIIGTDPTYRPFEYTDESGQITGVSAEIARAIGEELGRPVEFRDIPFDGLIVALKTGGIDLIISSMTETEERGKSITFSDPYVKTGLSVLVSNTTKAQSPEDLQGEGIKLAVKIGTTGESWSQEFLPQAKLVRLDTNAACVLEVVNGTVDGWVYDQISVMNYHNQHPDTTRAWLKPLREEVWGVGMPKNVDPTLLAGVNSALKRLRESGEMERIGEKYMADEQKLMKEQGLPFVFELD